MTVAPASAWQRRFPAPLSDLPHVEPGDPDLRSVNRFLLWVGLRQGRILASLVAWGIVWMLAQAAVPAALGSGIQAAADSDISAVGRWAAVVLGLGALQAYAGIMRHRRAVWNWIAAASRSQQLVTRAAARLGADLTSQVATGEVVAVTSSDVEKIGGAFDTLGRFVGAVIAFVAVGVVLVRSSLLLGLIVLIGIPLLTFAISPLLKPLELRERVQRERLGASTELASDTVAGLRVLRGIGGEQLFLDRFRASSQLVRESAVSTARIKSLLDALQVLLPGLFLVFVTWLGARLVLDGTLQIGELVTFYGYAAFLVLPLRTVTEMAHRFTRARVGARRIISVLQLERSRPEPAANGPLPTYDELVLGELSDQSSGLHVSPGRFVGIAADDPEEADALAGRLAGLSDGDDVRGEGVTLGGRRLVDLPTPLVRSVILLQDKDPVVLSGTFHDALAVPRGPRGDDPRTTDGLVAALETASAADVVEAVEYADVSASNVWSARITERGRSLSGGQRQRLALARSLAADAPVLVLDEPTSAVDAHTESRIAGSLATERAGRTTVVFTTSPLMLDRADQVALLLGGQVVAVGRHRELLHSEPRYRDLVMRGDS